MKKNLFIVLVLIASVTFGQKHFITDQNYLTKVEKKFTSRVDLAKNRSSQLFNVMKSGLSLEENEALKFLYAYMPLCDLADYNGDFFLKQVRYALKARDTFSWGKQIPEVVFRHFVLPYRVNNENLDTARVVFFDELKDRVKGLSLKEAALEVNHWCLEKVTYRGSDIRTSSPLASCKTAYGRCGEESTFTVTALRSVGIPARQVYTPRWAHCDDNHAWVEVWVDGKWYYMGACEPDADLNMGWFTEPARRAMLVHTKVFGDYPENVEVVNKGDEYTEINVIGNYADVKKIYVKVIDSSSKPAENAQVDFGLYNYAEFYPIASKMTDKKGLTYLTTGYGTLLIWGSKNGKYGYEKIAVGNVDTLVLKLTGSDKVKEINYDLIPPIEKTPYPVNAKDREKNAQRVKAENAIREKYRATFLDSNAVFKFADEKKLDRKTVLKYVKLSEGNWREIISFIDGNAANAEMAFALLGQVSEKDLRDTKASIMADHLSNALAIMKNDKSGKDIFAGYVLNPRIKNENLLAYRGLFLREFRNLLNYDKKEAALKVTDWIKNNVKINETSNYYSLPITPIGVFELKIANRESRDILFVAICRSLGIPSQLEPKLKVPQYYYNGEWLNVYFEKQSQLQPEYGYISFKKGNVGSNIDPKYYTHFTIGKLEKGIYKTIDYETEPVLSSFKEPVKLETGDYRLVTGNRRSDGAVFSNVSYFKISKGKTYNAVINLRDIDKAEKVLGTIDLKSKIEINGSEKELAKLFKKDNIILGWVEPAKEPTRHAIVEMSDLKKKYEEWGGAVQFIVTKESETAQFIKDNGSGLPKNSTFVKDPANSLLNKIKSVLNKKADIQYPLFVVINKKGEITLSVEGYKIGTGELLLKKVLK